MRVSSFQIPKYSWELLHVSYPVVTSFHIYTPPVISIIHYSWNSEQLQNARITFLYAYMHTHTAGYEWSIERKQKKEL